MGRVYVTERLPVLPVARELGMANLRRAGGEGSRRGKRGRAQSGAGPLLYGDSSIAAAGRCCTLRRTP